MVAESKNASTANLATESLLSPDLRRNVVGALADNLKAVSINKDDTGAFSEGEEFVPLLVILSLSWANAVLGDTCPF